MSRKRSMPRMRETPPVTALNLGLAALLVYMLWTFMVVVGADDYLGMLACSAGIILVNAYVCHRLNGGGPGRAGILALGVAFGAFIAGPLAWYLMNQFFLPRFVYMRYAEALVITVGGILVFTLFDAFLVMFAGWPLSHLPTWSSERHLRLLKERREREGQREGEDETE